MLVNFLSVLKIINESVEETAMMKAKLDPDLYKEVILSFRKRSDKLETYKITDYLQHFAKRDAIETVVYEEVF